MNIKFVFKFLGVALIVVAIQGCQATSQFAGKTPLSINAQTADNIERYLGLGNGTAIAVTPNGSGSGWAYCEHSNCTYPGGSAEQFAIKLCENHYAECKVFAVGQSIVWEGPISITGNKLTGHVAKLIEKKGGGRLTNWNGTANINSGAKNGSLRVKRNGTWCPGNFDATNDKWSLKCPSGNVIKGSINESTDSLFWGRSNDGRYELSIARKGWPKLEEKIGQHSATYSSSSNVKKTAPKQPTAKKSTKAVASNSDERRSKFIGSWEGIASDFSGYIGFSKVDKSGQITISSPQAKVKCVGSWRATAGDYGMDVLPKGIWSASCDNDTTISGTFVSVKPGKGIAVGSDNKGRKVEISYSTI